MGRASSRIALGAGAGFAIALALTPVISRLYQPAVFGMFATVTAVVSVFTGISTFRLEVRSQRTPDLDEADALLSAGLVTALVWGLVLTLVGLVSVAVFSLPLIYLLVGVLVVLGSLQLLGTAPLTRGGAYGRLGVANFGQGATAPVVQVVLGLLTPSVGALMAGFGTARLVWLPLLRSPRRLAGRARAVVRDSRRFALTAGLSAGVNSVAGQLPVMVTAVVFGSRETGQFAMATRVVVSPLGLVGMAVAAASVGEVGRVLRERSGDPTATVLSGMRGLALLGAPVCVLAGVLGVVAVPTVLGEQWRQAGVVLAIISVGTLAQVVAAPFSQLLNLADRSDLLLTWDGTRLVLVLAGLTLPAAFGGSFELSMACYSAVLVLLYVALGVLTVRAVRQAAGPSNE